MDQLTMLCNEKAINNCSNIIVYDKEVTKEDVNFNMDKVMKYDPKFCYRFVNIAGDYYY